MIESRGMRFLDRMRVRAFSLHILIVAAREFQEAATLMENADVGIRLMSVKNRAAGEQAHCEIGRLLHNFLASAKTLVDHTRVFMEEHYPGSALKRRYAEKVDTDLACDEVCKFVHDLRNYMLHCGLPNIERYVVFDQRKGVSSGVQLKSADLLTWDKWTAVSRRFLQKNETIGLGQIARDYAERVTAFHKWLDDELREHHRQDLDEFISMQEEHRAKYPEMHERLAAEIEHEESTNRADPGGSPRAT